MTDSFLVEGGVPLRGEVTPSGNKNAALPLICATLLTAEPVYLRNVPEINDVIAMCKLLASLGAKLSNIKLYRLD